MQADVKKDVLQRLKTVQGHVAGLSRMVEEEQYCIDIINQIIAVQRSLDKIAMKVLDNHLHTCVTDAFSGKCSERDPAERERMIEELLAVYQKAATL